MWTLCLKPAEWTHALVILWVRDPFGRWEWLFSRCSACWTWVWRSVWEVQCDKLNRARRDACEAPAASKATVHPCGHSAMPLVLPSGEQSSEFDGSSQSSGSMESAAASGFLLMTNSRLSPVSIIRGTVRQQSKSLVLTWFTCKIRINEIIHHSYSILTFWGNLRTGLLVRVCFHFIF